MNIQIGLTPEAIAERRNFIGASDANTIMSGDAERINRLAREKLGLQEPEDLSRNLAVVMGSYTEDLNRHWFELQTGDEVTGAGSLVTHPRHKFLRATLDGVVMARSAVFEAKHVSAFADLDDVAQRYQPQLHHQMMVTGLKSAVLSVFVGTQKWELYEYTFQDWYADAVLQACLDFWEGLQSGRFIEPAEVVEPPRPNGTLRKVDMQGHNEWASFATEWLATQEAAKRNAAAAKTLKGLVEPDVGHAFGHGVEIKRSSTGALTIRSEK